MPKSKFILALFILLDLGLAYFCSAHFMHKKEYDQIAAQNAALERRAWAASPHASQCMIWASQVYHVPPAVLASIMHVEGGHIGQSVGNVNGTRDLGPMQVNSLWVSQLARTWHVDYQTAYTALRDNGCENIYTSAWILRQKIAQTGGLYSGIAYYHSATPRYGVPYANKVVTGIQ